LSLTFTHSSAWAGPGSTGGGLSDARGDLLDFGEVNEKVPGSAAKILAGLAPNMEWFLSEIPIASSSDECKLVKEDSYQIAKQVDGEVALSRTWMERHDTLQQAGLIFHELIMFQLGKGADECSTRVRRAVRAVFSVDQLTAEQMQAELARVGIYGKTGSQVKRIFQLSNEIIQTHCNSGKPASENDSRYSELYTLTSETLNSPALTDIRQIAGFGGLSGVAGGPPWGTEVDPAMIAAGCKSFKKVISQYSQEIAFPAIN
jgi:hypothetical protein